jgi:hypothetical protein
MAVGEKDVVQTPKTEARAKQLALGAFAAVHQEAILSVHDHGRW